MHSFPNINIPHQRSKFLPLMNIHYHHITTQKFRFYIRVHSWCCTSMSLDKCLMTYIHHDSKIIVDSNLTSLKILCFLPHHPFPPFQPLVTTDLFLSTLICLWQNVILLNTYSIYPFQIGFIHIVISIQDSSMSFHDLISHFILVFNNIPFFGCINLLTHSPTINLLTHSPTKGHFGHFQHLAIINTVAINIQMQNSVWI